MIYFDDWLLKKDEGPVIARQYDNLTGRLEILGAFPEGWAWTLLVQADKHLDLIALTPMEGGLGVDLTAEMLAVSGYYTVQLKGVRGELVRHTNQVRIFYPGQPVRRRQLAGGAQRVQPGGGQHPGAGRTPARPRR